MTNEVEYFDWLKEQPVNQVPSTEQTIFIQKLSCHVVAIISPNLLKSSFVVYNITVYSYSLLCVIWTLLRELDNKDFYCMIYSQQSLKL